MRDELTCTCSVTAVLSTCPAASSSAAWSAFPDAMRLLCIGMTVVLRTVECERSISILNDIKTAERSR